VDQLDMMEILIQIDELLKQSAKYRAIQINNEKKVQEKIKRYKALIQQSSQPPYFTLVK